jgi:magnesium chelatase accessory protein
VAIYRNLEWETDGADWPLRAHSRLLTVGTTRWHIQRLGQGPRLLLLHGTGASTHSWRFLAPLLAEHHEVLSIDLPGHAFTRIAEGRSLSMPGMAREITALLAAQDFFPDLVVAHSASGPLAASMALAHQVRPRAIIAFNGAFKAYEGWAGPIAPALARGLVLNPLAIHFFAAQARDAANVGRLLARTGSRLDAFGIQLYARLFGASGHVASTIGMMARWEVAPVLRRLHTLGTRLVLAVAQNDRFVPPDVSRHLLPRLASASLVELAGLGHLAHEEDAAAACAVVTRTLAELQDGVRAGA